MRNIYKIKNCLLISVLFCCSVFAAERVPAGSITSESQHNNLFSPSFSQKFYEIAHDLAHSDDTSYIENELAILFLNGAMNLDEDNSNVRSLLLKCLCRFPERRSLTTDIQGQTHFNLVYSLLRQYVDENADITFATDVVSFLLNQAGSPVQKQILLEQMLKFFANRNPAFNSELLTMLGSLKLQNNLPEEAEKYFRQAYQINKYNKFAFSRLYELSAPKINHVEYLERLRLDFRENPIDIKTVLAFCRGLEQFQLYDDAAEAYEYCSDLFAYLYPTDALPADIYIPWSISCYNSNKRQFMCMEIAESIRKTGKFDIMLESLAGRAAGKLGEDKIALQIIRDTERKAIDLLKKESPDITESKLAWFYSFVIPMPDKAIEWSNKAFAANSDSPTEASLLAYSLTQKKEFDTAKSIINQFPASQISELALAQIQLEEGSRNQGIENLNRAISRDPGSFEAEHAKEILAGNGEKYIPPVDTDSIQAGMMKLFGDEFVPDFTVPEKMFSVAFHIRNKELSFGSDLDSAVSLVNNSSEPLVISEDSMFKGNIRIDALVSGDLNKRIPNLVSKRIDNIRVIGPGKSTIVSLKLITGELKKMLSTYPQASLNIMFILYIDPINISQNKVENSLAHVNPVSATVTRPGIVITGQQIRNLVDSISTGQIGQKIQSSQLFTGLLKEQQALPDNASQYHIVFTDGMKTMLKSALIYDSGLLRNPENGDWVVKGFTMVELLSLKMDYDLIEAVSENLYNKNWPVRLMAVYLLAESQGEKFIKVLKSISEKDQNQLVKDIAEAEMMKISTVRGQ